ncbi:MAG: hypothetical protein HC780_29440 [Leptolyngbyaceae cyanobacterium CSU_1_3]|nr:hypothetical protein [Leptolyngbyaceae cyanobacterium CSU_1_3]
MSLYLIGVGVGTLVTFNPGVGHAQTPLNGQPQKEMPTSAALSPSENDTPRIGEAVSALGLASQTMPHVLTAQLLPAQSIEVKLPASRTIAQAFTHSQRNSDSAKLPKIDSIAQTFKPAPALPEIGTIAQIFSPSSPKPDAARLPNGEAIAQTFEPGLAKIESPRPRSLTRKRASDRVQGLDRVPTRATLSAQPVRRCR